MKCKHCKIDIPQKRVDLGLDTCINCSTTEKVGCVDIVYHKTGNTIEILPKEQAEKMAKLAKRSSFGTLRAIVGSSGGGPSKRKIEKGCSTTFIGNETDYERIGGLIVDFAQKGDLEKAYAELEKAERKLMLSKSQTARLKSIADSISNKEKPKQHRGFLPTKEEDKKLSEVELIFRNWKNSKNEV